MKNVPPKDPKTLITPYRDGPLLIRGHFRQQDHDGNENEVARDTNALCRSGKSRKRPYCDGSHKGSGLAPLVFIAEKSETVWLCGCKRTLEPPFCDGSHESL